MGTTETRLTHTPHHTTERLCDCTLAKPTRNTNQTQHTQQPHTPDREELPPWAPIRRRAAATTACHTSRKLHRPRRDRCTALQPPATRKEPSPLFFFSNLGSEVLPNFSYVDIIFRLSVAFFSFCFCFVGQTRQNDLGLENESYN